MIFAIRIIAISLLVIAISTLDMKRLLEEIKEELEQQEEEEEEDNLEDLVEFVWEDENWNWLYRIR